MIFIKYLGVHIMKDTTLGGLVIGGGMLASLFIGAVGQNYKMVHPQKVVTQQQDTIASDCISVQKAIDLAIQDKFTPQKVYMDTYLTEPLVGDESEVKVQVAHEYKGQMRFTYFVITNPDTIKELAKMQRERKQTTIHITADKTVVNEITFPNDYEIIMK